MNVFARTHATRLLAVLLGACMGSSALYAQESTTAGTKTSETAEKAAELDAVVVTVELRKQDLQKYAGTAQSLSQDDLRGLGINNELRNLQVAVPGLSIANQEGNVEIFIRGVGSANNTELGDPGAAPHVNGNYIPRPRGLGGMFYDLDRVEINKGPQGTLRGRNALAGTLNIVTKRPELDGQVSGYVQAEIGNRDSTGAEFGVTLPVNDVSAFRFSGYTVDKGSSFRNAGESQNLRPAGIQLESSARISYLVEPSDELSIFAMYDYGHEAGTGYPGANIYSAARAGFDPEDFDIRNVVYRGPQGTLDSTNFGFQTNVSYDFDWATLEYNGSYREVDYEQTNASSDGVLWPGRDVSTVDYDVFSTVFWQTRSQAETHQLRLISSEDGRFKWTGGGFYFREKQQVGFFSLADKGYCCYSGTEFTMPDVRGRSWAGFFDGSYDVSDTFRVKGGVRYTDETKSRYGIGGNWALVLGGDEFACCFGTRLGTEGFVPSLLDRPNFDVTGLTTPADLARFLIEGISNPGLRDTLIAQLGGIVNGTRPNGTCIDRPDIDNGFVNCPPDGQHSFLSLTIPSQQRGASAFNFTDWRVGFEMDLSDDSLFYGTVATGHKAGGFNDSFDVNEIPESYRPEEILSYELGSKNVFDFFGRRSTFNVAGFFYDYSDQVFQDLAVIGVDQQGNANGFALVNRNVGKSQVYGIELESRLVLGGGFNLDLNALALETEIRSGVVADVRSQNFDAGGITSNIDLSGNELPLASKFQFNARLQQFIVLDGGGTFDWQVLASYRSSYFLTQYNNRDVVFIADAAGTVDRVEDAFTAGFPDQQSGYTQINLGLGYSAPSGFWRLEGYASNLTNEDVSQKALVGSGIDVRFLNDARAYGARLRITF